MSITTVAYEHIEILSPYEMKEFIDLKIVKKINDHARIYFTGVIPEEKKDSYVKNATLKDMIEVNQSDTLLFKGIVTRIRVKSVRGIYYLEVEGVSSTFEMDLKLKKRSFQNKDMTFKELISEVIKEYEGSDFVDTISNGETINKFIIQYDETDWNFLKRMASRFGCGIIADSSFDKPKFWFGLPKGKQWGDLEEFNYQIGKRLAKSVYPPESLIVIAENSAYYVIDTDKLLSIGDKITYQKINLTVIESALYMQNGILEHHYVLIPGNELNYDLFLNRSIFGASVEGEVIDIKDDKLRLHLEIDKKQKKEEAYWFPYMSFNSSEGNTGWYCMPELKDHVKLYFPTCYEEEGIIMCSVRRKDIDGNKISNPDIKYFRTKFGKEQMFSEKEVLISAKDNKVLIQLDEDNGVKIQSESSILIKADVDLILSSNKVDISAGEKIEMICKESSIAMNGNTDFSGTNVKVRCR